MVNYFNSLHASHLLITLAYSLDPDQAVQNIRPDLDPIFIPEPFFWKKSTDNKISMSNYLECKELRIVY